ncbi:MAG: hypothetical protein HQL32_16160 [Planctomycetes bacterium]|nr:hypothetical protein [Planctomycetota bacterium]
MGIFIKAETKTCVSPWIGLLLIVCVCVFIATAIYFKFSDKRAQHRIPKQPMAQGVHGQNAPLRQGARQAAFQTPARSGYLNNGEKLVF